MTEVRDGESIGAIAVIGMSGRFPGAGDVGQFWANLRDGVESVTFFNDEELRSAGVDQTALDDPNYVKAGTVIEGADLFDAPFFGFNPREAEMTDPQQRMFLECAYHAIEDAGYDPSRYGGLIGVFAGSAMSSYYQNNILPNPHFIGSVGTFQVMLGNDKDFVPTRVSYKLNLKGPSINIQTACSTSLVAIHIACQNLLTGACDMAIAGGVSLMVPQNTGYYYQEEGINSPDGHCRAFDAKAQGTIGGNGVAIVVLKRLEDAIEDGDTIHAVIKGSAINNDGSLKVGYTAPGVDGQAEVIATAQALAGVDPQTVTYIETHGTGTLLGDPIEIAALTQAFRTSTDRKGFCAIGSLKTNVGHMNTAAGAAGLIKTVLALKHKMLPPSLHFHEPNPEIDFANSPFYVNSKLTEWKTGETSRRAGVSSFGIGGTNAHVVLEEWTEVEEAQESRPWQLLVLSAKTDTALEKATSNLADFLKQHRDVNLGDLAYTYQVGRGIYEHRRMVVCRDIEDAVDALEGSRVCSARQDSTDRPVVFMFPGGGAQYINMGLDLYRSEAVFREHVDRCAELLTPHLGVDLRTILYPSEECADEAKQQMKQTSIALPALFAVEYALAKLWMEWGIRPKAMIGHSLGEYVAACIAGVFSLEDALALVSERGRLMQTLPGGAMLSISLPEDEVRALLIENLSIAAINAPSLCVVAGPLERIQEMEKLLVSREIDFRRLHIDVASHCEIVTPILGEFAAYVKKLKPQAPQIPYISNITGTWIKAEEATDPNYWAMHLRQPVRFADGIENFLKEPNLVLMEVGPGQVLSTATKQHPSRSVTQFILTSLRHPLDRMSDNEFLLNSLGQLWLEGVRIDWSGFYARERRRRIPLPTYPFDHQRYWVEPTGRMDTTELAVKHLGKKKDIAHWFYIPSWTRSMPHGPFKPGTLAGKEGRCLVFDDASNFCSAFVDRLGEGRHNVIRVLHGKHFEQIDDHTYTINCEREEDYVALMESLHNAAKLPDTIVHLWNVSEPDGAIAEKEFFAQCQNLGYYSLLFLAKAYSKAGPNDAVRILVISSGAQDVSDDVTYPEKSTLLGPTKVISQEHPNIACQSIDIVVPKTGGDDERFLIDQLLTEIETPSKDPVVAYRRRQRWVQTYEEVRLEANAPTARELRQDGVYLITGGLGRVGMILAEYLASTVNAKLILVGRSTFPKREAWDSWLTSHDAEDETSRRIQRLLAWEDLGAEVMVVSADIANEEEMCSVIKAIDDRFGGLNGVLHAAGVTAGDSLFHPLTEIGRTESEAQFQPKAYGLYVLKKVLANRKLDFCNLFSSNAATLGGWGFVAYSASNIFMDAFAAKLSKSSDVPWISANWDGWLLEEKQPRVITSSLDEFSMTPQESREAWRRVVCLSTLSQVTVSAGDFDNRLNVFIKRDFLNETKQSQKSASSYQRPNLRSTYVAPRNDEEQKIVGIWQSLLGVDQIGVHDNFFELGGHSLLGTQLMTRLREAFDVDMSLRSLFDAPTVAGLTEVIRQSRSEREDTETMEILKMIQQLSEDEIEKELSKRVQVI